MLTMLGNNTTNQFSMQQKILLPGIQQQQPFNTMDK